MFSTRSHQWRWLAVVTACLIVSLPLIPAKTAPPSWWPKRQTSPTDVAGGASSAKLSEEKPVAKNVRLNYLSSDWQKVLKEFAETTGSTLVMDRVPSGRFSRRDRTHYSKAEALRILNRDLEPLGFRLVDKGNYLIVLDVKSLRAKYTRPIVPPSAGTRRASSSRGNRDRNVVLAGGSSARAFGADGNSSGPIRLLDHEDAARPLPPLQIPKTSVPVQVRNQNAVNVSRMIYEAFRRKAELIDEGPEGLPGFLVFVDEDRLASDTGPALRPQPTLRQPQNPVRFAVGIDTNRNRLVVEADLQMAEAVSHLIQKLDRERSPGDVTEFVASEKDVKQITQHLQPALNQLVTPRRAGDFLAVQQTPQAGAAEKPQTDGTATDAEDVPATDEERQRAIIGGLKGEVTIEYVPGVGFILRGNEEDVKKVEDVLRLVEDLSIGTAPNIHLQMLQHVNSEALVELLTSVYEQVGALRGLSQRDAKTVSFLAVGKPNALLVIAPTDDLESVIDLIDKLDRPVDPKTEFMVFQLKSAVASQIETMLGDFYDDRPGLGTRVRVVADARTNSVVVQAQPRDLEEVAQLIHKIDQDASGAISDLKIFPLKNAIAEDLANLITQALQSVINPSTTGVTGATGRTGTGATSRELLEAKSTILQFLSDDGDQKRLVRSGILTDIRVTADPRTNSLVVTAPGESMDLMEALIKQLDRTAEQVAEIKIFTLTHANADSVADILDGVFTNPNQSTQQGQLGVQLAGSQDASSNLIGLRFSVDPRTNSIIAMGGADALGVVEAIVLRLDEGDLRQRQTKVIKLNNSYAPDVAAAINEFRDSLRALQQADPGLVSPYEMIEQDIIVVAEPVTNTLLISATPRYFHEVEDMVRQLDATPQQLIIQALLVEVVLDNTDEFGVELGFQDSVLFDRSILDNIQTISTTTQQTGNNQVTSENIVSQEASPGFNFNNQPFSNNTGTGISTSRVGTQGLSNFSLGRTNGDLGFGGLVLSAGSESVSVLIRALAANRHVEILSRPQIRTLDNQLAEIQVGSEVPRINGFTTNSTTGVLTPVVEQTTTGITLSVTPRTTPDESIIMEVVAEKSQLADGGGVILVTDATTGRDITSPVKDTKVVRTTVSVKSNQTIVLGGMITKEDSTLTRKVPWLGDLPVLGVPFRYDSTSSVRTELLIFLTPRIIHNDEESEMIKQIEAERIHFIEEIAEEIHGPIYAVPANTDFEDSSSAEPPINPPAPAAYEETTSSTAEPNGLQPLQIPAQARQALNRTNAESDDLELSNSHRLPDRESWQSRNPEAPASGSTPQEDKTIETLRFQQLEMKKTPPVPATFEEPQKSFFNPLRFTWHKPAESSR